MGPSLGMEQSPREGPWGGENESPHARLSGVNRGPQTWGLISSLLFTSCVT